MRSIQKAVAALCGIFLSVAVLSGLFLSPAAGRDTAGQLRIVREFRPVGYWPADEGQGDVLHDRSGNENHGTIYHVPWENGLLNFTSSTYQWAEIPAHPRYRSEEFTIGGWIFSRREGYVSDRHQSGMRFFGDSRNPWWHIPGWWSGPRPGGFALRLKEAGGIDVLSGGTSDAVGSLAGGTAVTARNWHHILYTYEEGTGRLYVNGRAEPSRNNVPYNHLEVPFQIGICGNWWMVWPSGESQSLDGTVRELVWFDRALPPSEVRRLYELSRPEVEPAVPDAAAIVLDHREISLEAFPGEPAAIRRRALEELLGREAVAIQARSAELLPLLQDELKDWRTRGAAVRLLMVLDSDESRTVLTGQARPLLIRALQDEDLPQEPRAVSAMALSTMGELAGESVPALVGVMESILQREGVRIPRVEDLLRNAVLRALIDLGGDDGRVREVLGRALAGPVLDSVDLQQSYLDGVRPLVSAGRYMDALDLYRRLPLQEHNDRFFSQGDPHRDGRPRWGNDRAYTPVAEHKGSLYRMGTGEPWQGVEPVSAEEYLEIVEELSVEFPEAADWKPADYPHLSRATITRIDPDGSQQTVFLEGKWFVIDSRDGKVRGWSLAVDNDGYLHVTGGKHNRAKPEEYIPGSWERMGASRDSGDDDYPAMLYWVSENPGDIGSLKFVGQRGNPRTIPVTHTSLQGMDYMNFLQDRNGQLYLYGRTHDAHNFQCWGVYRYDTGTRRWSTVGGYTSDVIESCERAEPGWTDHLIRNYRGGRRVPTTPRSRVMAWAWQPNFYNFGRDPWGVYFDRTNRMHVRMGLRGITGKALIIDSHVYAYSDDGKTFHRADGTVVQLPLTLLPAPEHNADVNLHFTGQWWDLWQSLIRHAGYSTAY